VLAKEGNTIAPPERPRVTTNMLPPKPVHPVGGRIRRSDIANNDSGTLIEAANRGDDAGNREDSQTEDSESDRRDQNMSNKGDNHEDTDSKNDSHEDTDNESDCRDKNASNKGDNCEDTEDSESDGRDDRVNIEGDEIGDRRPPHIAIEVVDFSTPRGKRHRSPNSSVGSRHSKATKRSASSAAPSERGPAISRSPSPIPLQGASRVSGGLFRGKATGNVYNFADGSFFVVVFYMFDDLVIGQVTRWM